MAMLNVTNIAATLKDWYLEGLRTQINEETDPLYSELEKTTEPVAGEQVTLSLRYGRSGGVGARADDGTLPTANARKSVKATFKTKNLFARMQITSKAIKASETNRGAFVASLNETLDDLLTDAKDNVQRQLYGDGTGKIATAAADATSSTTVTMDTVVGLAEGMLVDWIDGTDSTTVLHSGFEITVVNDDTNVVTFGTACTVDTSDGDYVVVSGSNTLEMTGLAKIFAQTGSIYGLARSSYNFLKSTTRAVSGEIDEVGIQRGLDDAQNRTGVTHDFLIGSKGVLRAWMNLKIAERQAVNTLKLAGGWEVPTYSNGQGRVLPFIGAKYAPASTLYAMARKNFMLAWMGDWDWLAKDGAILSRVADKAGYEATLELYADVCCDVIRGQVSFTSITEH